MKKSYIPIFIKLEANGIAVGSIQCQKIVMNKETKDYSFEFEGRNVLTLKNDVFKNRLVFNFGSGAEYQTNFYKIELVK